MTDPICPKCKKLMRVDTSKRSGEMQHRYYECCGYTDFREIPRSLIRVRKSGQRGRPESGKLPRMPVAMSA